MVKTLRAGVRWWVFLPLLPILIALVAHYSSKLFHSTGFYRLEWVAQGVETLDIFVLIPYIALGVVVLAPIFGPLGDPTSFPSFILVTSLPAIACCLLLYGVSVTMQIAFNKPSNKSLRGGLSVGKAIFAAIAIGAALLIAFFLRQYTSPFPWGVPTDRTLVKLFRSHRQTFETLVKMADEDATIASNNTSETLSVARRFEYSRLLSQINPRMQMGFSPQGVVFSSARGGILLSIGPGWEKGIACVTVPSRFGRIVDTLDKDPGHDDMYLVPIEGDWYVFYERIDYDRP